METKPEQMKYMWKIVVTIAAMAIVGIVVYSAVHPVYNVWSSEMKGKAELAQAEYNRQIAVVEANAKLESAKSLALAEVERAKGVAQANEIIGTSLKDNEDYLRYLWITQLEKSSHEVIYVPTEAQIPILEAGKR